MNTIYTLSIACVAGRYLSKKYRFVVELPTNYSLSELASLIIETADFDGDHLSDFYMANSLRGKKIWLTTDGEWDPDHSSVWERRLADIFPMEKNKKLYHEYDAGASWRFEITQKGKGKAAVAGLEYPHIVLEEGTKPSEYGPDDEEDDDEMEHE